MKDRKTSVSKLTDHTGYWLRMISNGVSYSFAKKLEKSDVTVAEWVVLREMYEGDEITSPSTVAKVTGLTRGAVSKLIDRLLQKKLVARKESKDDRRFQEIKLTAEALKLVPKLAKIADENDDAFFSVLNQSEQKQLSELLVKLAHHHEIKVSPID